MKKTFYIFLLLFAFAGLAKAQTANWFGYILPPSPAEKEKPPNPLRVHGKVVILQAVGRGNG